MSKFAELITSCTSQLASGTPIWKLSIPASFHHDQSFTEVLRDQMFRNEECLLKLNGLCDIEDPVERLGSLLSAILDPHKRYRPEKPFNPVFGEYVKDISSINGEQYSIEVEKVAHHPPCVAFRHSGPNYIIETVEGFESVKGLKNGINKLEISFTHSDIAMRYYLIDFRTPVGVFRWHLPGYRLDGILVGEKTCGTHGELTVIDPLGLKFVGDITLPNKVKGKIFGPKGNLIEEVSGDFRDGLYLKKSGALWYVPIGFVKNNFRTHDEHVHDPLLSSNQWSEVKKHILQTPPNWKGADEEKKLIEQAQRDLNKTRKPFESRFGFNIPEALVEK
jgi:hypothetical protein